MLTYRCIHDDSTNNIGIQLTTAFHYFILIDNLMLGYRTVLRVRLNWDRWQQFSDHGYTRGSRKTERNLVAVLQWCKNR